MTPEPTTTLTDVDLPETPLTTPEVPAHESASEAAANGKNGRRLSLQDLKAFYGDNEAVHGINLEYNPNEVTAMIGPSGCGKSTVLRCINRMHEEIPGAYSTGKVLLDGLDVYASDVDLTAVRRAIGMVFQKPTPFPTLSIFDNVAAGLKLAGIKGVEASDRVEWALKGAGLWNEVKDRLNSPGIGLSGGQQQRLCIARTIAVEPELILMDEPCSALDPIATLRVEELIQELKEQFTIVIVTHNMQQAARVADRTAFFLLGDLVEVGPTESIFTNPTDSRTEEYVSGKFG
ncbi:MAG: phosphate ABC transporter ATP-binding protein PstB [Solirubrobacteraceae bacterium]|nr:phosphate ABC transporter ATP-binding protein PstB [Patulibacter sp.]